MYADRCCCAYFLWTAVSTFPMHHTFNDHTHSQNTPFKILRLCFLFPTSMSILTVPDSDWLYVKVASKKHTNKMDWVTFLFYFPLRWCVWGVFTVTAIKNIKLKPKTIGIRGTEHVARKIYINN
jgi:hypothetical protein